MKAGNVVPALIEVKVGVGARKKYQPLYIEELFDPTTGAFSILSVWAWLGPGPRYRLFNFVHGIDA